jgi:hypothetical protein
LENAIETGSRYVRDLSFEELSQHFTPLINGIARKTTRSYSSILATEDIVQELMMTLWKLWELAKRSCPCPSHGHCTDKSCKDWTTQQFEWVARLSLRNRVVDLLRRDKSQPTATRDYAKTMPGLSTRTPDYDNEIRELIRSVDSVTGEILTKCVSQDSNRRPHSAKCTTARNVVLEML